MSASNSLSEKSPDFAAVSDGTDDIRDLFESGLDSTEMETNSGLSDSVSDTDSDTDYPGEEELDMGLKKLEAQFRKASQQVTLLDQKLASQHVRYTRANRNRQIACRYFLRLKAATVEGVRNAFYMYALNIAEEIVGIRRDIYGEDIDVEDYIELPEGYF